MTGPARLDLLIPVIKPAGQGSGAAQSFDELMRTDEREVPRQPARKSVEVASPKLYPEHVAQAQVTVADVDSDQRLPPVVLEARPGARPVRLFGMHRLAGGYLSLKAAEDEAIRPEKSALDDRAGNRATLIGPVITPDEKTGVRAAVGSAGLELAQADMPEAIASLPRVPDEREAVDTALAMHDVEEGLTSDSPAWLPQMVRLTMSSTGIATLWIRDFAATRDDIAARVTELCRRAESEGLHVGAVMVNGRPWINPYQDKESDA